MSTPVLLTDDNNYEWSKFNLTPVEPEHLNNESLLQSNQVFIHSTRVKYIINAFQLVRQSPIAAIYLKPIILMNEGKIFPDSLAAAADLTIDIADYFENVKLVQARTQLINDQIALLPNYTKATDTNVALKVLRYMRVRNTKLQPLRGIYSLEGYHYPQVDFFFNKHDGSMRKVIEFLEKQNLVAGKFIDKANFCGNCFSAFLNFREICPQCKSAQLVMQEIIHHFYCAYTGPEDDFVRGERMVCPKCKKELKHIGVDYDKPSIMYNCQDCDYSTQDPDIDTICYNCGRVSIPENLNHKDIREYSLTALAANAAIYGIDNLFKNILKDRLKITDLEVFKDYLEIEVARIKRYKQFHSCLCLLNIENLDEIYLELGDKSQHFFDEMAAIIKNVLRTSDIITSYNDSIFLMLLTETPAEGADIAMGRLKTNINELLEHNLNKKAAIHVQVLLIDGLTEQEELMEEIIKRGFSG
jgi:GGDEF domain-containing protein